MVGALVLGLVGLVGSDVPEVEEPLGHRIAAFAESKLGEKVGDGQCSGLVVEALRRSGARLGGEGWEEPWGDLVDPSEQVRVGDVLVFRDAVFERRQVARSGAVRTTRATMAHHVAIVSGVQRRAGEVRVAVLHQNAGRLSASDDRRQVVQRWVLDPKELAGGTVRAYRPVSDSIDGAIEFGHTEDAADRSS